MEDDDQRSLTTIGLSVLASLSYSYFIAPKIPKGTLRLLSLFPVFSIFLTLPLLLSSFLLSGIAGLCISWLATFKLSLFAFDLGPLASGAPPPKSLPVFLAIACLPVKIRRDDDRPYKPPKLPLNFAVKVLGFGIFVGLHGYKELIHPNILLGVLCCQVFLFIEIVFSLCKWLAKFTVGLVAEQPSDEPYLSTSLQDFWGRRWNLMVTNLLRQTVYKPVTSAAKRAVGKQWAVAAAVLATFSVSGLMHELLFYYVTRASPSWEMTSFFVLHGVCLVVEVGVKSVVSGRWRLHPAASAALTLGFVMVTSFRLFFPPLVRNGAVDGVIAEIKYVFELVKGKILTSDIGLCA